MKKAKEEFRNSNLNGQLGNSSCPCNPCTCGDTCKCSNCTCEGVCSGADCGCGCGQ